MERSDTAKVVSTILFLGWIVFAVYFVLMGQLNSMFSGIRRVEPPSWYEIALAHPGTYLGLGAIVVVGVVGWQMFRREISMGRFFQIDHDDSVWTYWSIMAGEMATAALLVHLTIYAVIGA